MADDHRERERGRPRPGPLEPKLGAGGGRRDIDTARDQILALVTAHAGEHHSRAVRLQVVDPDGEWLLGVNPDGSGFVLVEDPTDDEPPLPALGDDEGSRHIRVVARPDDRTSAATSTYAEVQDARRSPRGARSPSAPTAVREGHGRSVDRVALHSRPPGPLSRLVSGIKERLKDAEQREEERIDRQFERRFLVTDTNLPVVVSPKGGPGKTTVALIVGDAMASRMANQWIAAIDFNPGGGALEAVATEDRAARPSPRPRPRESARLPRP